MSFAGHVLDMLSRYRYNQSLKDALKNSRRGQLKMYRNFLQKKTAGSELKKISPEELAAFRAELKKKARKEMYRFIIFFVCLILLVALPLAYLLIVYLF